MKKRTIVMALAVAALIVGSAAFAYGPGADKGGGFGMGWGMMDGPDGGPWGACMGREGRGGGNFRNRDLTDEEKVRMEEIQKARLELRLALSERPVNAEKVAGLQDKVHGLRWGGESIPQAVREKMTELHKSALEFRLTLTGEPVDEKKATELHEKMLALRNDIARWRLAERLKADPAR